MEFIEILKEIEKNGFEAYIVGGFARDKYMNINSNDIDICTNAKPEELKDIFDDIDLTYAKYGNAILKRDNYTFEITTFRKDVSYNNRRPNIEFVETLKEDLNRRDFIINTLCIDSNNNYIDYLNARKDIDDKIIRLVGTKEKLKEDPLRILRAIRFSTILNFKLDDEIIEGIKEYGYLVETLSYNRKKEELDKIFDSKYKKDGIYLLLNLNLDKYLQLEKLKYVNIEENIWKQLDVFGIYPFSKKELKEILK